MTRTMGSVVLASVLFAAIIRTEVGQLRCFESLVCSFCSLQSSVPRLVSSVVLNRSFAA